MARKKLHREPVLKDWAEVNDALRSIHEYEHALTEMGVDMSRRIDAVKAEYTKSAEPLQKRACKNRAEAGQRGAEAAAGGSSGGCGRVSENHG